MLETPRCAQSKKPGYLDVNIYIADIQKEGLPIILDVAEVCIPLQLL